MVYLETPTNPTLKVLDIARLAAAGHAAGAIVVADNTFATPINQLPLQLGADLVLHSATKFLGGHADALGGVVCGDPGLVGQIYHYREITGATARSDGGLSADPRAENAAPAHPPAERQCAQDRDLAANPARGGGGLLPRAGDTHASRRGAAADARLRRGAQLHAAGRIRGGQGRVLPRLRYAHRAANLGAVETIVGPPATTSHVECTAAERAAMGIPEGLIRYSVGIEDADDLIADLTQALAPLR